MIALLLSCGTVSSCADEQPRIDESRELRFDGKVLTYDAALPVLTELLDNPSVRRRIEAATALQWFGVRLMGTAALPKLLSIVNSKEDFSLIDKKMTDALAKPNGVEPHFSNDEIALMDTAHLKSASLTAAVMSGDVRSFDALQRFLASTSFTEREIAIDARHWFETGDGGAWLPGKQPPPTAEPRIPFGAHARSQVKLSEFKSIADKVLQEKDTQRARRVFDALNTATSYLLSEKDGAETLVRLLRQTGDPAFSAAGLRELRMKAMRSALQRMESLPIGQRKALKAFAEAAAMDADDTIAEWGTVVLRNLK